MDKDCIFCNIPREDILFETKCFVMIYDKYPVSPGHILIVSKEHREDFFDLTANEMEDLNGAVISSMELIRERYSPDGYNIGANCGESAGQTLGHFHYHVIPRYTGDTPDPRGGIRRCIEGKGAY